MTSNLVIKAVEMVTCSQLLNLFPRLITVRWIKLVIFRISARMELVPSRSEFTINYLVDRSVPSDVTAVTQGFICVEVLYREGHHKVTGVGLVGRADIQKICVGGDGRTFTLS